MDSVVHFEMPYGDRERAVNFYQKAFGWKAQLFGPEMGEYAVVQTAETDEKGMIQQPGRINGGLFKKTKPDQVPSLVIAVEDIRAAMERVKQGGGTVLPGMKGPDEPDEIPGVGTYCAIIDTEGNRVGLLQPVAR